MTLNNNEDMFIITLSRGYVAKLSEKDRDLTEMLDPLDSTRMKPIKYSAVSNGYSVYAVRSEKGNNKKKIYLAREIMERVLDRKLVKGETVCLIDHSVINGVLDYTRANLRIKKANKLQGDDK